MLQDERTEVQAALEDAKKELAELQVRPRLMQPALFF